MVKREKAQVSRFLCCPGLDKNENLKTHTQKSPSVGLEDDKPIHTGCGRQNRTDHKTITKRRPRIAHRHGLRLVSQGGLVLQLPRQHRPVVHRQSVVRRLTTKKKKKAQTVKLKGLKGG